MTFLPIHIGIVSMHSAENMEEDVFTRLEKIGIIPVVTLPDVETALRCADALMSAGLPAMEVTFRTTVAVHCVKAIREQFPEMLVGAGTLLTEPSITEAMKAGAHWGAAPGFDSDVLAAAKAAGLWFLPGVCTPSEIGACIARGHMRLKFFPAEPLGGIRTLSSMIAPFLHLGPGIVAMGSISEELCPDYLRLPFVIAVGVSWVCPDEAIRQGNWNLVTENAKRAAADAGTEL